MYIIRYTSMVVTTLHHNNKDEMSFDSESPTIY